MTRQQPASTLVPVAQSDTLLDPARRDTRTAGLDLRGAARLAHEIAGGLRRWVASAES